MTHQEFIEAVAKGVKKYAPAYGIKVHSPIIAQAILESGWGESKLAATYHNYFGLKCGTKWKGKSVNLNTMEEYTPGTLTKISDNFRVFGSMDEGIKGYFEFIQIARYQNLKGITDPRKYLETIKADGYATSSTYVENNMRIVNQYNLTQYDSENKGVSEMSYSRSAVVNLVNSWVGKNESDGSYKSIIDLYNSKPPFPRNTKMEYGWAWCACTWSAVAKALGYTAIMPVEISCYYLMEAAKKMGIWVENDGYTPSIGDAVLYDWDDGGAGDDTGTPDHVGTVTYVNRAAGYFVVTEGNASNMVKKRTVSINGRYIRGFITPKYTTMGTPDPVQAEGKSVDTVAHEVIAGKWGNGDQRTTALKAKGYDPAAVQKRVNEILNGPAKKAEPAAPVAPGVSSRKVESTCYATGSDPTISGRYITTADLYCRNDAGTNKRALCLIPKGTVVNCYGYYSTFGGVRWYYIQTVVAGVTYVGFSSSKYLEEGMSATGSSDLPPICHRRTPENGILRRTEQLNCSRMFNKTGVLRTAIIEQ